MLKKKLINQIDIYKKMIVAYDEMFAEGIYDCSVLKGKKGTLEMIIENLEKLIQESEEK